MSTTSRNAQQRRLAAQATAATEALIANGGSTVLRVIEGSATVPAPAPEAPVMDARADLLNELRDAIIAIKGQAPAPTAATPAPAETPAPSSDELLQARRARQKAKRKAEREAASKQTSAPAAAAPALASADPATQLLADLRDLLTGLKAQATEAPAVAAASAAPEPKPAKRADPLPSGPFTLEGSRFTAPMSLADFAAMTPDITRVIAAIARVYVYVPGGSWKEFGHQLLKLAGA